jgi:tRNA A-37 threonylcarbamoyl transferase component Bud32
VSESFLGVWDEAFRPELERWFHEGPGVAPFKEGPLRALWRWRGTVVKQYRSDRWPDSRPWFAYRAKALREYENLRRLDGLGIAVPKPLAAVRGPWHAYLFTREVVGAVPLIERVEALEPRAFGRFVAEALGTGLVHRDLHLGNVLVADGVYTLVDLHRAFFEPPSRFRIVETLGFLLSSLVDGIPLRTRLTFLSAFADFDRVCGARADRRAFLAEVDAAFLRARHVYTTDRVERVMGDSSMTTRLEVAGVTIVAARGAADADGRQGTLVKQVGRRALYRTPGGVALKTYRRGFWRSLWEGERRGPGAREWRNAFALKLRRIPVPEPLRLAVAPGVESVESRWIDGALPLNQHVAQHGVTRALVWRLARLLRRMHDSGAAHRDLKANNVLVRGDEIYFIDLDRVTFSLSASPADRLLNLAQLNAAVGPPVTWGDRLRFYRAYAGRDREWHTAWKPRVREIMRITKERRHVWPALS